MVQYSCPYCGRKFPSKRRMLEHIGKVHQQPDPSHPPPPSNTVEVVEENVEKPASQPAEDRALQSAHRVPGELDERRAVKVVEEELWVKASPIVRKVLLNPVIYLYYDYVRQKYGYRGDLGDFIYDCVTDFFKSRGIKIKIVEEEEVES